MLFLRYPKGVHTCNKVPLGRTDFHGIRHSQLYSLYSTTSSTGSTSFTSSTSSTSFTSFIRSASPTPLAD